MNIRTATIKDLEAVTSVEAECFPPAEAATREELAERLKYYADHFWLMFDGDKLIAFVDGFVTDEENLTDEMYAKAQLHNESGAWQMIFGGEYDTCIQKTWVCRRVDQMCDRRCKKAGKKRISAYL